MFLGSHLGSSYVYIPKSVTVSHFYTNYSDKLNRRGLLVKNKQLNRKVLVPLSDEELYQRLLLVLYTGLNDWGILNSMPKEHVDYVIDVLMAIYFINFFDTEDDLRAEPVLKL